MQQLQGDGPLVRIGELSRRLGVSVHVLRAWESRYGLLQPTRSTGGFRLYSGADEARIRRMQAHLAEGLSAAEAARTVLRESGSGGLAQAQPATASTSTVVDLATALRRALDAFDEPAAQAVLDQLMSEFSLATVLRDVLIPYLAELGDRWHRGTATVAQEHFASNVLRGRLAGLARGWGSGHGPRAVLACPSGEQHDLALMIFGIVLNRNGWRIDYLGANTPIDELDNAIDSTHPDLVVLAATRPEIFRSPRAKLLAISRRVPLAIAGAGATPRLANTVQARLLPGDPVTEAEQARWPQRQ
jgi:MerR family transcriptional regulator, light-induced transcriptional regulator